LIVKTLTNKLNIFVKYKLM